MEVSICMENDCQKTESVEEKFMKFLKYGTLRQIKEFLTKNSPMNLHYPAPNLKTPLTSAIDRNDHQILSFLLERNPTNLDETTTQPWGRTALMYAAFFSRNPEVLQLLLKKGADVERTDFRGWSCLQYAIVGERLENVTLLLNNGVSVNQRDHQERTPLMISVYLSNSQTISLLLDRGAEINARDKAGFTALQLAILWRKRDSALLLIERGSDMTVTTPSTRATLGELCQTTMPNILRCIESKKRVIQKSHIV